MAGIGETMVDYERKPVALLPPHIEPAKSYDKIPVEMKKEHAGTRKPAYKPRLKLHQLVGAGLVLTGTLFTAFNPMRLHYQGKERQSAEQAKQSKQVVLAETELRQSSYSYRLGQEALVSMPGTEQSPDSATIDDAVKNYAANRAVKNPEAKNPEFITRQRTSSANETPKVLEMMLDAEKKGKSEYVFVVDKETQRAKVYKLTYELVDEADVSTGRNQGDKERSGDNKTPNGIFEVQGVENSSNWTYEGKLAYGPKAAKLNTGAWDAKGNYYPDKDSDILAHGTNEPEKLGTAASHGCVRFPDELIQEYVDKGYLKKGTLFAIVENNNYVPARIKVGALAADNANLAVQKPANQAYEKYGMDDKRLGFIIDTKSEAKVEAKAVADKIVANKAEAKSDVNKTDVKGEIK